VPDLAAHDVYLCGPHGFAQDLYGALREAGVPDSRIHHESFEL
jgi:ferredoxin-NADP reductase